jgi:clan AA aspartic protease (TIGR02281 family)
VLGCVVNGPGEARETDIGITGGGNGKHMVYLSGVTDHHVQDEDMVDHIVRWSKPRPPRSRPVKFMVDTGATPVALTIEDAARIGVEFQPDSFSVIGSGASGPVRGERVVLDSVDIDGKAASDVRGSVIEGLDISLLGQAYLSELEKVEISGDEMVLR